MIEKALQEINTDDLRDLAIRQVPERRTLDYKRDLNFKTRDEKKEFVADVLSFANSAGGDLIFGMDEAHDANGGKLGYPEAPVGTKLWAGTDDVKRAMEQCIRDSSDPRMPALETAIVDVGLADKPVVIVRIPKSTAAPHRSLIDSVFYSRATTGRYQLDVRQLRGVFLDAATQEQAIRNFARERVRAHCALASPEQHLFEAIPPIALPEDGKHTARLVVHVISSTFSSREQIVDVRDRSLDAIVLANLFPRTQGMHWKHRRNLDGVALWQATDSDSAISSSLGYRQLFRSGATECVDVYVPNRGAHEGLIFADAVEEKVIENVKSSVHILNAAGCAFPMFVFVALTDVRGRKVRNGNKTVTPETRSFAVDRENLVLPNVALENPDANIESELRPVFDALWQAGGWQESPLYATDGTRLPEAR